MQSALLGFVTRLDGRHTKDRITSASVFLDDKSGHNYYHLQTSTGYDESAAAKILYDVMTNSHSINVNSLHADNVIFTEKQFRDEATVCYRTYWRIKFIGE